MPIPQSETDTIEWEQWRRDCLQLDIKISDVHQALFASFYEQLITANQVMNLTRITALHDFLYRHLLDCFTVLPWLPLESKVVDIGSGAGFPAIPMAIMRPDLKVTAVESIGKKCRFIEQIQTNLGLGHLKVIHTRSEELAKEARYKASFDCAVARAVAALPLLLDISLPLLKPGGRFLAMKGLRCEAELDASQKGLQRLRATVNQVVAFPQIEALKNARLILVDKY